MAKQFVFFPLSPALLLPLRLLSTNTPFPKSYICGCIKVKVFFIAVICRRWKCHLCCIWAPVNPETELQVCYRLQVRANCASLQQTVCRYSFFKTVFRCFNSRPSVFYCVWSQRSTVSFEYEITHSQIFLMITQISIERVLTKGRAQAIFISLSL